MPYKAIALGFEYHHNEVNYKDVFRTGYLYVQKSAFSNQNYTSFVILITYFENQQKTSLLVFCFCV